MDFAAYLIICTLLTVKMWSYQKLDKRHTKLFSDYISLAMQYGKLVAKEVRRDVLLCQLKEKILVAIMTQPAGKGIESVEKAIDELIREVSNGSN